MDYTKHDYIKVPRDDYEELVRADERNATIMNAIFKLIRDEDMDNARRYGHANIYVNASALKTIVGYEDPREFIEAVKEYKEKHVEEEE